MVAGLVLSSGVLTTYAETNSTSTTSTGTTTKQTERLQNIVTRANQEIIRRITSLNSLSTRVNAMAKLTSTEKQTLSATIQSQIQEMQALRSKIASDTSDLTNLKADVESITKAYRIYMLIVPQGTIEAAADRVLNLASSMQTLTVKLQTRVSALPATTANLSAIQSALADISAKLADANIQAEAAINGISGLTPDNGDKTKMQANNAALKDARTKLKVAQQDIVAARKDAGTIIKDITGDKTEKKTEPTKSTNNSEHTITIPQQ